jgi:hypothetical protein
MPVTRCRTCGKGMAGYLDSEKELSDLTSDEISSEIFKYEAKEARIRSYMHSGMRQVYPDGMTCPVVVMVGESSKVIGKIWSNWIRTRREPRLPRIAAGSASFVRSKASAASAVKQ